jgi:ABC-2 type transport system permease protein
MSPALWTKAWREARWLLAGCCAVVFAFNWIYVWLVSQLPLGRFRLILELLPAELEKLSPVPWSQLLTTEGRVAMSYSEPLVMLIAAVWGIGRGSDAVSGELGRGTLEMLLGQPVRRSAIILSQGSVTALGAGLIAMSAWLGTAAGLSTIQLESTVQPGLFVLPAINLFALTFFLAGITTLASAPDRYRWRTLGIAGSFYVVEMIVEVVGLVVERAAWIRWLTFFSAYKPPRLVTQPDTAVLLAWQHCGVLIGLGLVGYLAATAVFCRRDLPAPL